MEQEYTDKLKHTLSEVQGEGKEAVHQAKRESHQLADEAKSRLDAEVTARKGMVAKELGNLGSALEVSAGELDKKDSALGEPVRQIAQFCERSASSVSRKGTRELVAQVESFGREQPLLFFGAALAAGFLATRLLRSDSSQASAGSSPRAESIGSSSGQGWGESARIGEQPPSPAVPTSETLDVSGPASEGDRPYGTT